jgi:hypothetical protein
VTTGGRVTLSPTTVSSGVSSITCSASKETFSTL